MSASTRAPREVDAWRRSGALLSAALALVAAGCDRRPAAWIPAPVETSMTSVRSEVEAAAEDLDSARGLLEADPAAAGQRLDEARGALERLLGYYLPLVDARARAYDACRHCSLGETHAAAAELDQIEVILLAVADRIGPHLEPEIARRLETVSDARAALTATPEQAPELLERLAHELNFMVIKGGLILPGAGAAGGPATPGQ